MYGVFGGKSIGSGTIIDEDGTILTCAHAVVNFQGRSISSKGKVIWWFDCIFITFSHDYCV